MRITYAGGPKHDELSIWQRELDQAENQLPRLDEALATHKEALRTHAAAIRGELLQKCSRHGEEQRLNAAV
jgi:hypothetical protein